MNLIILFQVTVAVLALVLIFLVFDHRVGGRKRSNGSRLPLIVGTLLPLYGLGYLWVLFYSFNSLTIFDQVSFVFISVGFVMVLKARMDLRGNYAWPGQFMEETQIVKSGIYAYMRHPIYTGVGLFLIGTIFTVVAHSDLVLGMPLAVLSASLLALLASVARHEETCLARELGDVYVSYVCEVHAFLPFSQGKKEVKYENNENGKVDESMYDL
ncbi:MAG: methyltransferase family protein [Patescibacteria group bacterium]